MIDLINLEELTNFINNLGLVTSSQPFSKHQTVFFVNKIMFALIDYGNKPLKISLLCDKKLADVLKEKYEEVVDGINLNPKKWISIIITGQLNSDEIKDLIRLSYQLAININLD